MNDMEDKKSTGVGGVAPAPTAHDGLGRAREAFAALMDGTLARADGRPVQVLKVEGAPRSGKTTFAIESFVKAWRAGLDPTMTVRDRITADRCNAQVLDEVGVMGRRRPVGTLGALAYELLTSARAAQGLPLPKLLNGAEQESAIRSVLRVHLAHAGQEDCDICRLFHDYFNTDAWSTALVSPASRDSRAQMRERLNQSFVSQLRDSFARLSELDIAGEADLNALISRMDTGMGWADTDLRRSILLARFKLVYALRAKCEEWVRHAYPDEWRLDSAQMLVQARKELEHAGALPRLLVVDDWQDITLAGARLLSALAEHGTRLLLVGCNDESVQTFRGAYPEALSLSSRDGFPETLGEPMQALLAPVRVELDERPVDGVKLRQIDRIAARVSQHIGSVTELRDPVPNRPGKLHAGLAGSAFEPMDSADKDAAGKAPVKATEGKKDKDFVTDGSCELRVFRSRNDEAQDLLWQVTRRHVEGLDWKDMAVITHDNGTLRALGERLEREGVPVTYSRVTRPLKDETVVQGLFALVDLANGVDPRDARGRFATLLASPLVGVDGRHGAYDRPVRVKRLDSAFRALATLDRISRDTVDADGSQDGDPAAWQADSLAASLRALSEEPLTIDTLYAALLDGDHATSVLDAADRVLSGSRDTMRGGRKTIRTADESVPEQDGVGDIDAKASDQDQYRDRDVSALGRTVGLIRRVRDRLASLEAPDAAAMLWEAWDASKVSPDWQRLALEDGMEGRLANQRLDVAMRLFDAASIAEEGTDVTAFMDRIRETDVAADSLAHVGPVEDAVTLTTPAGAAGRSWTDVWLPSVQQGEWPNLAPRDTMFGVEDLADLQLRGQLGRRGGGNHDERLLDVLYGELKGFLVALTRATGTTHLSATWSGDDTPSGFLFDYLPEMIRRRDEPEDSDFATVGAKAGEEALALGGLEVTRRGLVALARRQLAQDIERGQESQGVRSGEKTSAKDSTKGVVNSVEDAVNALAQLADAGVPEADPANWAFVYGGGFTDGEPAGSADTTAEDKQEPGKSVFVSPSGVDAAWACPLQWALDRRMAGPQPGQLAASFGTLIHKVAQQAAELRYDRLVEDGGIIDSTLSVEENEEKVTARICALYDGLVDHDQSTDDVATRIKRHDNDAKADTILRNIAGYFVTSQIDGNYLKSPQTKKKGVEPLPKVVGKLIGVESERPFNATFAMEDLWKAYRRTAGHQDVSKEDFAKALDLLASGLPEGARDLSITLTGRIDRLERRNNGTTEIRVIDWKTGKKDTEECFNDLQLVCYQLGLAFPGTPQNDRESSGQTPRPMTVTRSMLFPVGKDPFPAPDHGPERAFQPRMFQLAPDPDGPDSMVLAFDGRYKRRTTGKGISKYYKSPLDQPSDNPAFAGTRDESGTLLDSNQLEWCLTMVARVLYAAGYMRPGRSEYPAKLNDNCKYCAFKDVCPLWPDDSKTVMEAK